MSAEFDLEKWLLHLHPDYPVSTFEDQKVQRHRELMRQATKEGFHKALELVEADINKKLLEAQGQNYFTYWNYLANHIKDQINKLKSGGR